MRNGLAVLVAAVAAFTLMPPAWSLGFGDIEVNSALNQPLDAEIQLHAVEPDERDAIDISLASPKAFERFGIVRSAAVDNVNLEIVPGGRDGRMHILLTTREPIREPFLTLLVEARWSGQRALREYTLLLDPPVSEPQTQTADAETTESEPPESATSTSTRTTQTQRRERSTPAPAAESGPATRSGPEPETRDSAGPAASDSRRYGPVAANETLWSIAKKTRPSSAITMNQMLLAIYQANVENFDGNINLMHEGARLTIPPADEIRRINAVAAADEVEDQMQAFRRMRSGDETTRTAETEQAQEQPGATASSDSGGELHLEPAEDTGSPAADGGAASEPATADTSASSGNETLAALSETATRNRDEAGDTANGDGTADAPRPDAERDAESPADTGTVAGDGTDNGASETDTGANAGQPANNGSGDKPAGDDATSSRADTATEQAGDAKASQQKSPETGGQSPSQTETATADTAAGTGSGAAAESDTTNGERGATTEKAAGDQTASSADDSIQADSAASDAGTTRTGTAATTGRAPDDDRATDPANTPGNATETPGTGAGGDTESGPDAATESPAAGQGRATDQPAAGQDATGPVTGAESVIPESGSLITPRRLLLLFAGVLLVVLIILFLRRRQYKPVPADFSGLDDVQADDTSGAESMPDDAPTETSPTATAAPGLENTPADAEAAPERRDDHDTPDETTDESAEPIGDPAGADERPAAGSDSGTPDADLEASLAGIDTDADRSGEETPASSTSDDADTAGDFDLDLSDLVSETDSDTGTAAPTETSPDAESTADREDESDTPGGTDSPQPGTPDEPAEDAATEPASADDGAETVFVDPAEFGLDSDAVEEARAGRDDTGGDEPDPASFDISGLSLDEPEAGETLAGDTAEQEEASGDDAIADDAGLSVEEQPDSSEPQPETPIGDDRDESGPAADDTAGTTGSATDSDEITTKLDLARAYLDMGESEMASTLLEEVHAEGDDEQRREAANLLTRT